MEQNTKTTYYVPTSTHATWTPKKQARQWTEDIKNNSNQNVGCSHWNRKQKSSPFSSPFK